MVSSILSDGAHSHSASCLPISLGGVLEVQKVLILVEYNLFFFCYPLGANPENYCPTQDLGLTFMPGGSFIEAILAMLRCRSIASCLLGSGCLSRELKRQFPY